jgi:hypothetical protein
MQNDIESSIKFSSQTLFIIVLFLAIEIFSELRSQKTETPSDSPTLNTSKKFGKPNGFTFNLCSQGLLDQNCRFLLLT